MAKRKLSETGNEEETEDVDAGLSFGADEQLSVNPNDFLIQSMTPKVKRMKHTVLFKVQIIEEAEKSTNREVARLHNIDERCIRRWRAEKDKLLQAAGDSKTQQSIRLGANPGRKLKDDELDREMYHWILSLRERNIKVTWKMMQEQVAFLARNRGVDLKGSNGWCRGFIKRHNLNNEKTELSNDTERPSTSNGSKEVNKNPLLLSTFHNIINFEPSEIKQEASENEEDLYAEDDNFEEPLEVDLPLKGQESVIENVVKTENQEPIKSEEVGKSLEKCLYCPKEYETIMARDKHMINDHYEECKKDKSCFQCPNCSFVFS